MEVVKLPTQENLADALTKGVESETLKFHVQGVGAEIRRVSTRDCAVDRG